MDPWQPVFGLDVRARRQLRETRETLLAKLRDEPDDFTALFLADVVVEISPDRDPDLAAHAARFRATRGGDWKVRARERGLDRLLFHLANGWKASKVGHDAIPVLERRAAEIGEARPLGVAAGHIDASYIPASLAADSRASISYHPNGHLQRVAIEIDRLHHGELVLSELPGNGRFAIVEKRGGYGTSIREDYSDGAIRTTINTPWHDGDESTARKSWTRWVEENLADLARLAAAHTGRTATPRAKRRTSARR